MKKRKRKEKQSAVGNSTKMQKLYSDIRLPGSYSGIATTHRYSGRSRKEVVDFLSGIDGYSLHKPIRKVFPRRAVFSKGIADLVQADLVDLSHIAQYNDGHRFLLVAIDVFSKKCYVVPIKSKSGRTVASAFETILEKQRFNMCQTDKGSEFYNSHFRALMEKWNIRHYSSENDDLKASVVERLNRTLKERMFRYFTTHQTRRYIDVLPDLIHSYNNTYHRSIGMTPSEVTSDNEDTVRKRLYPVRKSGRWKFDVGQTVRIVMQKLPFQKGYEEGRWSRELFVVDKRLPTKPVTYRLVDMAGESIKGAFYEAEIQKVRRPESDSLFEVERVIKTRKKPNGKVEYLVKWQGYPEKFNSWTEDLVKR